tara:strand:- start:6424 stop:7305 length:882 start_codon:yes stop_codon:yes gene_type:complete
MKILFIGSVEFSKKIFDEIIKSKNEIVGVIGKKKNNFNSDYFDITRYSKSVGIPSIQCKNINSKNTIDWIKRKNPEIIICIGWSKLLKKKILSLCKFGVIGYHPSDLPNNRGRHPIIWTLALGLKKIGSTFFIMDSKADSGDIISKKLINVSKDDNARKLYNRLIITAKSQIRQILKKLANNTLRRMSQKKKPSNFWRKRNELDGQIDWRMSADSIYNLIRALSDPYPGAFFNYSNKKIFVWKSKIVNVDLSNLEPGKILYIKKGKPIIKCGDRALKLENYTPNIKFKNNNYL